MPQTLSRLCITPMLCNCCVSSCTVSERWQEESMCLQYRHECWLQYLSPQCLKSLIQNPQNYCVPVRVRYCTLLFFESGGRSLFFSLGLPIPVSFTLFCCTQDSQRMPVLLEENASSLSPHPSVPSDVSAQRKADIPRCPSATARAEHRQVVAALASCSCNAVPAQARGEAGGPGVLNLPVLLVLMKGGRNSASWRCFGSIRITFSTGLGKVY